MEEMTDLIDVGVGNEVAQVTFSHSTGESAAVQEDAGLSNFFLGQTFDFLPPRHQLLQYIFGWSIQQY